MPGARSKPRSYVTKEATSAAGFNKGDFMSFHYFNPNGAVSEREYVDGIINKLVDLKELKTGFILAYGSLDYFSRDSFREAFNKQRTTKTYICRLRVESLREDTARSRRAVCEALGTTWEAIEERIGAEVKAELARKHAEADERHQKFLAELGLR